MNIVAKIIKNNKFTPTELYNARLGTGMLHVVLSAEVTTALLEEYKRGAEEMFIKSALLELADFYGVECGTIFYSFPAGHFCTRCDKWLGQNGESEFLFGYCENCAIAEMGDDLARELKSNA